jgi:DNA mismatch repair protein MutS
VESLSSDYMLREESREHLGRIPDIERIATRIVRLSASPNDLLSLRGALEAIGPLKESLAPAVENSSLLERVVSAMEEPPGVRELISAAISEESGEVIRAGYSAELDEAREFRDGAHEWLTRFEADERMKSGLKSLKVGYRDGEGYFIEIPGKDSSRVPPHYEHRKALKHNARYVTVELKEHESRMLTARDEGRARSPENSPRRRGRGRCLILRRRRERASVRAPRSLRGAGASRRGGAASGGRAQYGESVRPERFGA